MPKNKSKNKKSVLREWVEAIIVAAIIATFVRTFFFQMYRIPTSSMEPVLMPGDNILVTRLSYGPKVPFIGLRIPGFSRPQRGDVVVFVPPHEKDEPWHRRKQFVKRLIASEGEEVLIKEGKIYINGDQVTEPAIAANYYFSDPRYGGHATGGVPAMVPQGRYFFLGDNSGNSEDGRSWGFTDREWVLGRAIFVWWPLSRIGRIR